jgi:hypothetical protein
VKPSAWRIFASAVIAGIAGDALMRGGMLRLGFTLWILTVATSALVLGGWSLSAESHNATAGRERALLLGGTVAASLGLVWRDSLLLFRIDFASVLCMGALTIWHGSGGQLGKLTVLETIRAALLAVINSVGGAFGLMQQRQGERGIGAATGRARAITVGIVLALPPLAIVTALLASSDVVFKAMLDSVLTFLEVEGFQHVVVALICGWLAAGWLRAALGHALRVPLPELRTPALPFLTVGVGLYALVAVLTAFMITQLRVLFGGERFLMATRGLTVANYARDGFFELILAAGVVLATLIVAEWLLSADVATARRQFRLAGSLLLALVFTLLASAATRMWLYVREFGLSTDRAFAWAVMLWVAIALAIFAATMLRGRTDRFAPMTLIATVAWVALLNVINLDAIVVRVNVARAQSGGTFDASYHAQLSADALPALLAAAPSLPEADCDALSAALKTAWSTRLADPADGGQDWRALNWTLWQARRWYATANVPCVKRVD